MLGKQALCGASQHPAIAGQSRFRHALTAAAHLALIGFVFSGALRRKCPQSGGNTLLQTPNGSRVQGW